MSFRDDPAYIAARRKIIRENHPDAGGSDESLIRELKQLDEAWARKSGLRSQLEGTLPGFIPDDIASQAMDTAEEYLLRAEAFAQRANDRATQAADNARRRAERVRQRAEKLVPKTVTEHVAARAGKAAGRIRRVIDRQRGGRG